MRIVKTTAHIEEEKIVQEDLSAHQWVGNHYADTLAGLGSKASWVDDDVTREVRRLSAQNWLVFKRLLATQQFYLDKVGPRTAMQSHRARGLRAVFSSIWCRKLVTTLLATPWSRTAFQTSLLVVSVGLLLLKRGSGSGFDNTCFASRCCRLRAPAVSLSLRASQV